MPSRLVAVGLIDVVVLAGAYWLEFMGYFNLVVISWAISVVGLVTFFGLLAASDANPTVTTRFALAAGVVAVWFASVGALLFYQGQTGDLAGQAFDAVTLVMGVVVAFYFGAEAYRAVGVAKAGQTNGTTGAATTGSAQETDA